jgi:Leucine-rich repeat (LRR) protein
MLEFLENNTFNALINLKILRLNNNKINNIDGLFDKTLLLEIINLSKYNLIRINSFRQLKKIKYIDSSENSLSEKSKSLF